MPTGVALRNPRALLFDAAESVLRRDGPSGLTSRAVTTEAGVAKGVMHRHFADFDAFLADLILDRVAKLELRAAELEEAAGTGSVVGNLTDALVDLFGPLAVASLALVVTRSGLRHHLREAGAARLPLMTEGTAMIAAYLTREQACGRLAALADPGTLAPTLIGAIHLLFTDRESGPPDGETVRKVVAGVLGGVRGRLD